MRKKQGGHLPLDGEHHAFKETHVEGRKLVTKFIYGQMLKDRKGKWSYNAAAVHLDPGTAPNSLHPQPWRKQSVKGRSGPKDQRDPIYHWKPIDRSNWEAIEESKKDSSQPGGLNVLEYLGPVLKGMPRDINKREHGRYHIGTMSDVARILIWRMS